MDEYKLRIIEHAFDESRYHRGFHHTLFNLFLTIFLSITGLLVANFDKVNKLNDPLQYLMILLFIILAAVYRQMIIRYHKRIATINSVIAGVADKDIVNNPEFNSIKEPLKTLYCSKYKDLIDPENPNVIKTGNGHMFFIRVVFVLVVVDILIVAGTLIY